MRKSGLDVTLSSTNVNSELISTPQREANDELSELMAQPCV
jgi:hypothetical protein